MLRVECGQNGPDGVRREVRCDFYVRKTLINNLIDDKDPAALHVSVRTAPQGPRLEV
jgi:hypothetical protein